MFCRCLMMKIQNAKIRKKSESLSRGAQKKHRLQSMLLLSYQDSNLDKQNQNLMCYHYTIGQSTCMRKIGCKSTTFSPSGQIFFALVGK